jgi:hypothetical protein
MNGVFFSRGLGRRKMTINVFGVVVFIVLLLGDIKIINNTTSVVEFQILSLAFLFLVSPFLSISPTQEIF